MSSVCNFLQWNILQKQLGKHILINMSIVRSPFKMEYPPKTTCEAQIDLICPVYLTFYIEVSFKNNLWSRNWSIYPGYVTFYNRIHSKNNLRSINCSNMSSVRNFLLWKILQKLLVKHKLINMSNVRNLLRWHKSHVKFLFIFYW